MPQPSPARPPIADQRDPETAHKDSVVIDDASFRTLAEVAPAGIWRTLSSGECVYVNRAWEESTGLTKDQWFGHGWSDGIHPEDRDRVFESWTRAISHGEEFRDEWRWQRADGATPWILCMGAPEYDDKGEVIAYVGINIDITRNRELAAELTDARERAERAATAKTSFLANMSHEIRTPMNGVIGFTELLLESDLDDEQNRHANMIATSGRAMMSLLNDILDLSKIEAGLLSLEQVPFDLRHKTRTCIGMLEPAAREKGLSIEMSIDKDLPSLILGDPLRFRQILLNLIGNAVKFTESGSVKVRLDQVGTAASPKLRTCVIDSGIGIAPAQLESIFDPFIQSDGSIARKHGGSGLGLAISRQLAEMLGGTLSVESTEGRGSTFTLDMPLAPAATSNVKVQPAAPAPERLPHRRVLVAEDHEINQHLIMEMTRRAGLDPVLACNGAEAIAKVTAAAEAGVPFAAILMDMQMPEIDGLEATRQLRARGFDAATLPILALTANCYPEDVESCLEAGMQGHIGKPVRMAGLVENLMAIWGADEPPAANTPSGDDPMERMRERYHAEKGSLLRSIAVIAQAPDMTDWDHIRRSLHKIAGVAAHFEDAEFGEMSRQLEHRLIKASSDQERLEAIEKERLLRHAA